MTFLTAKNDTMSNFCLFSLLLLLPTGAVRAQQPPPAAPGSVLAQAKSDVAARRFADAVTLLQAQPNANVDHALRHALADAQYGWAQDLMAQFQYAQAIPHYQACYDLDKGDRLPQSGDDLGHLGLAHYDLSQYPQALGCSRQALAIHRQIGDRAGQAGDLNNLGNVFSYTNRPAQALGLYQQALPLERLTQEKAGEAATLNGIGNARPQPEPVSAGGRCFSRSWPWKGNWGTARTRPSPQQPRASVRQPERVLAGAGLRRAGAAPGTSGPGRHQ